MAKYSPFMKYVPLENLRHNAAHLLALWVRTIKYFSENC